MKDLTIVFLGQPQILELSGNVEIVYSDGSDIDSIVEKSKAKYITFVRETDKLSKNYLPLVARKIKEDFDCCFINYVIDFKRNKFDKVNTNETELAKYYPFVGEFIWAFIFKRYKLLKVLDYKGNRLDSYVKELFTKRTAIGEIIYNHNPAGGQYLKNLPYVDAKYNEYYKNIIYFSDGICGTFNGYISWVKNIGRCFGKKYDITLLYDEISELSYKSFTKLNIRCVKRENYNNYLCDKLLTSYSDYFYPKNVIALESFLFIHGSMSDYNDSRHFKDDIYDRYFGVSKTAAKKAEGYFPTKNIEYVLNPFKIDKNDVKPHLRLVSAQRSTKVKCPERIEQVAAALDELDIPYTWNVFSDTKENTNKNGLVFRKRNDNPLSYIQDSDYFVLLSDSEAMPYCIIEALSLNTKVIVTPLDAYKELGIKNNEHGVIIPFEYFKEENKEKLKKVLLKAYKEKDKKIKYSYSPKFYEKYNDIFLK